MEKSYKKDQLTIHWQPEKCIHSARCVKGLPEVFHPATKPWITPEESNVEAIKRVINHCPSGALSFSEDEDS